MALKLQPVNEQAADGALDFPIGETVYRAEGVSAETGRDALRFITLAGDMQRWEIKRQLAAAAGDDPGDYEFESDEEEDLFERWTQMDELPSILLGDAYEEMLEDDVPYALIQRAAQTMMAYVTQGEQAAAATWHGQGPQDAEGKDLTRPGSKARSTTKASRSGSSRRKAARKTSSTEPDGSGETS